MCFLHLISIVVASIAVNLTVVQSSLGDLLDQQQDTNNQLQCWKLKRCDPGTSFKKRCGLEENQIRVHLFKNQCEMYEMNCKKYTLVIALTPLSVKTLIEFEDESIENFVSGVMPSKEEKAKVARSLCEKVKTCNPDFEKVCGFNELSLELRLFENRCDLYKTNCEGKEFFRPIVMGVCEARTQFLERQGLNFQAYSPPMPSYRRKTKLTTEPSVKDLIEEQKSSFEKQVDEDFIQWMSGKEYKYSVIDNNYVE